MKKTLLSMAVLAASGAAFAQSTGTRQDAFGQKGLSIDPGFPQHAGGEPGLAKGADVKTEDGIVAQQQQDTGPAITKQADGSYGQRQTQQT